MTYLRKSKRRIRAAVIHTTFTPARREVSYADLWQWHVVEGPFSDIGYHALIQRDGTLVLCRDIDRTGAHAKTNGFNHGTIGIALAGGMGRDNMPEANNTVAQLRTLRRLTNELKGQYGDIDILGHHDTGSKKACPCFDVRHWVATGEYVFAVSPEIGSWDS
jgi:N-acetyl-anhydromuramyl-L-alanine amidase AmpD